MYMDIDVEIYLKRLKDFFNNDEDVYDVLVIDKNGNTLSRKTLMTKGDTTYTNKDMREAHNLQKMLKGNSFNWR